MLWARSRAGPPPVIHSAKCLRLRARKSFLISHLAENRMEISFLIKKALTWRCLCTKNHTEDLTHANSNRPPHQRRTSEAA